MASETPQQGRSTLTVPRVARAHYAQNLIKQVVCEFRFPTLFELEAAQPPLTFARALRKDYPAHGRHQQLNVAGDTIGSGARGHVFRSKNSHWAVTLKSSSVSIETTRYDSFADFKMRVAQVLTVAKEVIDTDFFTRVGLRYINSVPFGEDPISDWVNPKLVALLADGVYGEVEEYSQRVSGYLPDGAGAYLFQHGVGNEQSGAKMYVLDFDFSREDVDVGRAIEVLQTLHDREFDMFTWSLGHRAKEHLGPSDVR